MKKVIMTESSPGVGTYTTADATLVDLINPNVQLDDTTEIMRVAAYGLLGFLLGR